jgi:hypothetical protein
MIEILDQGPQLDVAQIAAYEQRYGLQLPEDYKAFLLAYNGGRPEPSNFKICNFKNNPVGRVKAFLGIGRSPDFWNLDYFFREIPNALPKEVQPIASTSGPDYVVLSIGKNDFGTVYYWDAYNAPKKPSRTDLYYVAKSFTEFLNTIYEETAFYTTEERLIRLGDLTLLANYIQSGHDVNALDEYNRNLLEQAVICNKPKVVKFLFSKGAKLRSALKLAEQNLEFFPEFGEMVQTIKNLSEKDKFRRKGTL